MGTLYFRQLLAGRDFAQRARGAAQMQNFVYLIGDSDARECVIVDPAYGVEPYISEVVAGALRTASSKPST